MENHPIPQDVTGFQFKLVGSLTLKQFAFLAVGTVISFVFWYAPVHVLIKAPVILLAAGGSTAFAFLPIAGRPLDAMLGYFIKALVTPNQYVYHKLGGDIALFHFHPQAKTLAIPTMQQASPATHPHHDPQKDLQLQQYLESLPHQNATPLDNREQTFIQQVFTGQQPVPAQQATPPPAQQPQAEAINQAPLATEPHVNQPVQADQPPVAPEQALQQNLTQTAPATLPEVTPAQNVQQPVPESTQQAPAIAPIQHAAPAQEILPQPLPEHVRQVPQVLTKAAGLPHTPDVPNILIGIIRDPRGNILPNILVEVKDSEDNPVRAFKTNMLGQFASATPLANGSYSIIFEDPKGNHQFDSIQLTANGQILSPIEIISHDAREELRRALFT